MTFLALALKPFFALLILGLVVLPIALALQRILPPGRVKDALYKRRIAWWDMPLPRIRRPGR